MNFPQKDSLQVEDETWTVLAIGPDASKKIDMVTGTPVAARALDGMLRSFYFYFVATDPARVVMGC